MDPHARLQHLERIIGAGFGRLPRLAAGGLGLAIPPGATLTPLTYGYSFPADATLAVAVLIAGGGGGSGGITEYYPWSGTYGYVADSRGGGAGELVWSLIDLNPYRDSTGAVNFSTQLGAGGYGGGIPYAPDFNSIGEAGQDSQLHLWKPGPYPWSPHDLDLVITAKGGKGGNSGGIGQTPSFGSGGRAIVLPRPGVWETHQPGEPGGGGTYGGTGDMDSNQGFGGRGWPGGYGAGGDGAPHGTAGDGGYPGGDGLVSLWWC